jgi:prepilin peptidase CpaA
VPHLDAVHWALAALLMMVLAWAAVTDVITRQIPNAAVLVIIGLFALWTLAGAPAGVGSGVGAAAVGFAFGFILYLFKIMGAGDVKLFAAIALFVGLSHLPMFALATAIAGGAVAALSLLSRPREVMVMLAMHSSAAPGRGVPYGVPISLGGLLTLWAVVTGVNLADVLRPHV